MTSAMTRKVRFRRGWVLTWLACGFASAGQAQTGAEVPELGVEAGQDAAGPAQAEPAPSGSADVTGPEEVTEGADGADTDEAAPSDLVIAEPVDPIASSERQITSTIDEFGRRSLQTAEAYIDLADALRQADEHERAAENYLAAVEVYRSVDGPFTPLAIAPLTSLGDNYHDANDDVNAVAAYSEARTVSRRAYGLHNEEQIELLDRISRSLLDLNQLSEAEAQQVEALRLVQRSHPPASDAVLDAIYKYAEWLGERGLYQLERDQYTRALRVIRQHHGEQDARQVQALRGIGNTYREERNPASLGFSALQDALALLQTQPEKDVQAIAGTLRDIGDWLVAFGKTGYDGSEYQRAWQLLGSLPEGDALRREWFGRANYVLHEPISARGLSTEPGAASGHVTVKFDLDTSGNTQNVALVESEPAGFKDEAVLRHIRRSRFRPILEDGRVVQGKDLAIQVTFRYLPDSATDEG